MNNRVFLKPKILLWNTRIFRNVFGDFPIGRIKYDKNNWKPRLIELENARVLFKECFVVNEQGLMYDEINEPMGQEISLVHSHLSIPKPERTGCVCAVLPSSNNYFHWMFETLPRIKMLEGQGYDNLIVDLSKTFKAESISKLSKKQVIDSSKTQHLVVDKLLCPTMPCKTGHPTKEVCDYLREHFLPKEKGKKRRIYISRSKASKRKVVNEVNLIDFLERHWIETVELEGLSVSEQAKIFSEAELVIGLHGAGLTNLVFCDKKTRVIELFNPNYLNKCYEDLSNLMGLDYKNMFCDDTMDFDISVDFDKLWELIK